MRISTLSSEAKPSQANHHHSFFRSLEASKATTPTSKMHDFAKFLTIKSKLEHLLEFFLPRPPPGSVMLLTHAVMHDLEKAPAHGKLAECQTRDEVLDLLHEEILDKRTKLYYLVTVAENWPDTDTDLLLKVGAMAEDHVSSINDEQEALARVYSWLTSEDVTREDRVKILMTYSRTEPYLKYKNDFDNMTKDWRISTIIDFVRELDEEFKYRLGICNKNNL